MSDPVRSAVGDVSPALYGRIQQLQLAFVGAIDEDRLEALPDLFTADGEYRIVSRENSDLGLPMPLFHCRTPDMLRDRIVSLRHANVFNPHVSRHLIGPTQILATSPGEIATTTGYALYQTTPAGQSSLFSVGCYQDRLALDAEGRPLFRRRIVRVDTFAIPTLLSTPI